MKKLIFGTITVILFSLVLTVSGTSNASDGKADTTVLKFDIMAGVTSPYTGSANPIRGINGGGVSWVLSRAEGSLKANGELKVEVKGLVLGPDAPTATRGTNPVPTFKAIVSCQSINAAGQAIVTNISTRAFPASTTGDSKIEDKIALPGPCIAPIIFVVHGTAGAWFATTGV